MNQNKNYYMGFIAYFDSYDSSILNLKLKHGFEIRRDSLKNIVQLTSRLDNSPRDIAHTRLIEAGVNSFIPATPDGDRYVYYFYNSFVNESVAEFYKKNNYLSQIISAMRLFKEGDISLSLEYRFYCINGIPHLQSMGKAFGYHSRCRYRLKNEDFPKLQELIESVNLPFKNNFLKLAFENFQLSYYTNHIQLQFLTLMNCMEVLFHPSNRGELRYRISRNVAVLLGKNMEDSKMIYKEMKNFYDERSNIVHRGKGDINLSDVLKLRYYARESIKRIYELNKGKDELLALLNSSGFGQPP
jgi:hypothetical protein